MAAARSRLPLTAEELNVVIQPPEGCGLVEFMPHHLRLLKPDVERSAYDNMRESAGMGPAFTLIVHGKVAACFGLVIPWPGLAEAWMLTNDNIKPIAVPFTYGARKFCAIAAQSLHLRRIQIHVQISNDTFYQWAKAARFRYEGRCDAYTPDGESVLLMARIFRRRT